MLELINNGITTTEISIHTCIDCKEFMYNDPYILEYGSCGFCINELADNKLDKLN